MPKKDSLDIVASEVTICTKCPLWESRKNAVPGVGPCDAKIIFIGEAPGRTEDTKGEPFVGSAGKLLDNLLSQIGLSRKQVFITNIVKCRPPANRPPKPLEIKTCAPYLKRQISIIRPNIIATLGSHSAAYVFSEAAIPFTSITQVRGKPRKANIAGWSVTIFPTFHPASALYYPDRMKTLQKDFKTLKKSLKH